jgi:hypothetical protein
MASPLNDRFFCGLEYVSLGQACSGIGGVRVRSLENRAEADDEHARLRGARDRQRPAEPGEVRVAADVIAPVVRVDDVGDLAFRQGADGFENLVGHRRRAGVDEQHAVAADLHRDVGARSREHADVAPDVQQFERRGAGGGLIASVSRVLRIDEGRRAQDRGKEDNRRGGEERKLWRERLHSYGADCNAERPGRHGARQPGTYGGSVHPGALSSAHS